MTEEVEAAVMADTAVEAFTITGAGWDDANGLYVPTERRWHDALVYENDRKCLLSREPHRTKSGQTSYGWILGQDGKPLYGIQSAALAPPATGWRKFKGTLPAPEVHGHREASAAANAAATALKDQGNVLFAARRYAEADERWTRALGYKEHLTDVTVQVALYSNRAEARLRRKEWKSALRDAEDALVLRPGHDKALLRAAVAAKELQQFALAQDFVMLCLEHHPKHAEAKKMCTEIEQLVQEEREDEPDKATSAKAKLRQSFQQGARETLENLGRQLTADIKASEGFEAFAANRDKSKAKPVEADRPPLESLPYHHMGLPQEQIDLMDKFFQENREKKAKADLEAKDRRTARERLLDEEEAAEGRQKAERIQNDLLALQATKRGEPTRFSQAASEVYCWWSLPAGVAGKEITVRCMQGGAALTVMVREVAIFDRKLFQHVKADQLIWTLEDHELHLTLTKAEKDTLWEQLGEVPEMAVDSSGEVIPETIPEPMTAAQRVAMWRDMVQGDDGEYVGYEALDRTSQKYVDTMRRYEHARATGNAQELAEAELDMEEFGRVII
mmetsp:Transcript_127417/g.231635  ORF Transcript_127417/g.231635 Transcript_127417/m.231635 type:complete len:561 (+) Transcript_127417:72-1754(+)